jgi:putative sigma-54 modulation protein
LRLQLSFVVDFIWLKKFGAWASANNLEASQMNLHMTGHHVEITPSLREYANTKMLRVKRHFEHVIDVNIILTVEKLRQKAEISVHLSGKDIYVESTEEDMYAAIDSMIDKLDRQVMKHKEKSKSKHQVDAVKRMVEQ